MVAQVGGGGGGGGGGDGGVDDDCNGCGDWVIDACSVCTDCSADVAAFRRVAGSEAEAASSHD